MFAIIEKVFLTALLAAALLVSGCSANNGPGENKPGSKAPEASEAVEGPPVTPPISGPSDSKADERLQNPAKDAYSGIEIDAFMRERKAVLPGFPVAVTVIVKNAGEETVDYVQGSGEYETPEAVFIIADGLQAVLPADHLGPVTLDFQTKELKPGEELQFVMHVMAIEPNANLNKYAIDMYNRDGKYIAEKNWDELQKEFPGLIPAKSGSYNARAYFVYYLRGESGAADFTKEPSGYAECDFSIPVS